MIKEIFRVPDMHCSSCVMLLEGLGDYLPAVRHVKASYRKRQVEVEYDEARLTSAEIAAAIRKLGYTVA
jgi:copper chaperone CopZ